MTCPAKREEPLPERGSGGAGPNQGGTAEVGRLSPLGAKVFLFGRKGAIRLTSDSRAGKGKTEGYDGLVARLDTVRGAARAAIEQVGSAAALEEVRVRFLGRSGELTQVLRGLGQVDAALRPELGRIANEVRAEVEGQLTARGLHLAAAELSRRLEAERLDITLPGTTPQRGTYHPVSLAMADVERVFTSMGFEVAEGPDIETDWYNFQALNMPRDHPARDMQASFYFTADVVLRTQTSPVQIRYMRANTPALPVKIIAPGRVYRCDDDATHSPVFHQVEGLVVDRGITLGDLKGVLDVFARAMFGPTTRTRFRPSYFPFTEPSAEVDVSCTICGGSGCRTCKNSGWIEILGAGLVHTQVLRNGGYDPEMVSGFAFGLGIERVAMLRYGIADIRLLYGGDVRFLRQFRPAGEGRAQA